jgi:hypothetical protein
MRLPRTARSRTVIRSPPYASLGLSVCPSSQIALAGTCRNSGQRSARLCRSCLGARYSRQMLAVPKASCLCSHGADCGNRPLYGRALSSTLRFLAQAIACDRFPALLTEPRGRPPLLWPLAAIGALLGRLLSISVFFGHNFINPWPLIPQRSAVELLVSFR